MIDLITYPSFASTVIVFVFEFPLCTDSYGVSSSPEIVPPFTFDVVVPSCFVSVFSVMSVVILNNLA